MALQFTLAFLASALAVTRPELVLVLEDDFTDFNLSLWKHELNLGGGGNYEFQYYTNNRTSSYAEDGVLHIQPTLLADQIGEGAVRGFFPYTMNVWGAQPADLCTGHAFFGCERQALGGGNFINPVKSARIRTAESFSFTYGKVEVRAKLPIGDWLYGPPFGCFPRITSTVTALQVARLTSWNPEAIHHRMQLEAMTPMALPFTGDWTSLRTCSI